MTTTTSQRSTTLPLIRLAALVVAIAISVLCYRLYILYAVGNFYMPDQPHYSFWLLWTPLALAASYLFVVAVLVVLVRAAMKGRIEFNPAGAGIVAERAKEPGAFWAIFCIGLAVVFYMLWLIVG